MKLDPNIEQVAASAAGFHAARCKRGKAAKKRLWQLIYDVVVATLFAHEELTRRNSMSPTTRAARSGGT